MHDYYAVGIEHHERQLILHLVWREYSRETDELEITRKRTLRFSGVEDLDATSPVQVQEEFVGGGWRDFFWRILFWIIGKRPPPETARDLISCINAHGQGFGEPLSLLDSSQEGFILDTVLSEAFYIRCDSVEWV